jgi:hypothetical protein
LGYEGIWNPGVAGTPPDDEADDDLDAALAASGGLLEKMVACFAKYP